MLLRAAGRVSRRQLGSVFVRCLSQVSPAGNMATAQVAMQSDASKVNGTASILRTLGSSADQVVKDALEGKHVLQKLGKDDILVEDEELLSKEFLAILKEMNGEDIAEVVGIIALNGCQHSEKS